MNKLKMKSLLLMASLTLLGCENFPPSDHANLVAMNFYLAQQEGDVEKALRSFASKERADSWERHLAHLQKTLGKPISYSLTNMVTNTPYKGKYYNLTYLVEYDRGTISSEVVTLYNSGENSRLKIVDHKITADGYESILY